MAKFFATYGLSGYPFEGGWTEIEAPDFHAACCAFRAFHPNKVHGLLNCCDIYSEEEFLKTEMSGPQGNYGFHAHETIIIQRELTNNKEQQHETL